MFYIVLEDIKIIYDLLKEFRDSAKKGKEKFKLACDLIERVLVRFAIEWENLIEVKPMKFYKEADALFERYEKIIIDTIIETRNYIGTSVIMSLKKLSREMKAQANKIHCLGPLEPYIEEGNKILEHASKIESVVINAKIKI